MTSTRYISMTKTSSASAHLSRHADSGLFPTHLTTSFTPRATSFSHFKYEEDQMDEVEVDRRGTDDYSDEFELITTLHLRKWTWHSLTLHYT